jgi:hypothetical protein
MILAAMSKPKTSAKAATPEPKTRARTTTNTTTTTTRQLTDPGPSAEDDISHNRALPFLAAAAVPAVPAGYRPAAPEERKRRLRPIAETLRAESLRALREVAARGPDKVKAELGDLAPPTDSAGQLATRIEGLEATLGALRALVAAHEEIEDIALTDAQVLLENLFEEYQHRAGKVPSLAQSYPQLVSYFAGRSALISEGRARSKKTK